MRACQLRAQAVTSTLLGLTLFGHVNLSTRAFRCTSAFDRWLAGSQVQTVSSLWRDQMYVDRAVSQVFVRDAARRRG
jgi:hypothetical protein